MAACGGDDFGNSLDCPVCWEMFRDPKTLLCGHSLCAECIDNFRSSGIKCPLCRRYTRFPTDGLMVNFSLKSVVEKIKQKKNKAGELHRCEACNGSPRKITEMWKCNQCSIDFICATCVIKRHMGHNVEEMKAVSSFDKMLGLLNRKTNIRPKAEALPVVQREGRLKSFALAILRKIDTSVEECLPIMVTVLAAAVVTVVFLLLPFEMTTS